jgi:hypothetical protein
MGVRAPRGTARCRGSSGMNSEPAAFCGGRRMTTVRRERNSPANPPSFKSGVAGGSGRSSDSPRGLRSSSELGGRENTSFCRPFPEAAEGIRTLDLLHGKQNLTRRWSPRYPCKWAVSRRGARVAYPRLSPRDHGVSGLKAD